MKKEYDFKKGHRGRVRDLPPIEERARHTKVRITIHLDADVLEHFKKEAAKPGALPYQTQINHALREHVFGGESGVKDELVADDAFIARLADRVAELGAKG